MRKTLIEFVGEEVYIELSNKTSKVGVIKKVMDDLVILKLSHDYALFSNIYINISNIVLFRKSR